jgi:hypothetical protein
MLVLRAHRLAGDGIGRADDLREVCRAALQWIQQIVRRETAKAEL